MPPAPMPSPPVMSPRFPRGWARGVAASLLVSLGAASCSREAPPSPLDPPSVVTVGAAPAASASASAPVAVTSRGSIQPGKAAPGTAPVEMVVVGGHAQVFLGPVATKGTQIGYLKRGSRVQADATPVPGGQCPEGWLRMEPVGFVCARHLSADLNNAQGKAREPAVEDILPYRYGHNVAHGTPLYRGVPTRDEMAQYEPYLKIERSKSSEASESRKTASAEPGKKRKKRRRGKRGAEQVEASEAHDESGSAAPATSASAVASSAPAPASSAPAVALTASAAPALTAPTGTSTSAVAAAATATGAVPLDAADAGAPSAPLDLDAGADAADDSNKPWWQRTYEGGKGPEIRLADLEEGKGILARRMAKGFYVAIDHTFFANGRGWHKTTAGLVAPSDRLALVKGNEFHGQEIDEANAGKALAFVLNKQATTYVTEGEGKPMTPKGALKRYDRVFLSGQRVTSGSKAFRETVDGVWLRESDIAYTEPGARPAGVGERERWVDVNLSRQTLVAFEGDRPVFATLVSSGRKGQDKAHDHQTPRGMWRVREKHVAATMDGDGAASGDMPYSIEDVPYVMYFHESYALHGAFWHDNFGRQQSHGCVNLAPLDAKRLFFWSEPIIPKGWFGMYSSADLPGSTVVVHD